MTKDYIKRQFSNFYNDVIKGKYAKSEDVLAKIEHSTLLNVGRARYDLIVEVLNKDGVCTVKGNPYKARTTNYNIVLEPYAVYKISTTSGTWDGGMDFATANELPEQNTTIDATNINDQVTSVLDTTTKIRTYTYTANTTDKYLFVSTYEQGGREISVKKVADSGILPTIAKLHADNGWAKLEDDFKAYVDKYIAENGYVIGENSASAEEIYDWLLNKDNYLYRGKVTKSGNFLVDKNGEKFNITGIGTHFLSHEFDYLYTYDALKTLKYLGVNCLRLTSYVYMGQYPQYSYTGNEGVADEIKEIIDTIIPIATQLGLYIIIDWHDLKGSYSETRTIDEYYTPMQNAFFEYFSDKYKEYDNVFYEIFNEPFGQNVTKIVERISSIRDIIQGNKADAIMISGITGSVSNFWNALQTANISDVFMSQHFYWGDTENPQNVINNLETYVWDKFPMFNTEWGNAHSSGEVPSNDRYSQAYMNTLTANYIPHCVWKYFTVGVNTGANFCCVLADKPFGKTHYYKYGGFNRSDLTHNGKFYFDNFRKIHFNTSQQAPQTQS